MQLTDANSSQIDEAIAVNEEARLQALKISLLGLAVLALLGIVPAARMPDRLRLYDDDSDGDGDDDPVPPGLREVPTTAGEPV